MSVFNGTLHQNSSWCVTDKIIHWSELRQEANTRQRLWLSSSDSSPPPPRAAGNRTAENAKAAQLSFVKNGDTEEKGTIIGKRNMLDFMSSVSFLSGFVLPHCPLLHRGCCLKETLMQEFLTNQYMSPAGSSQMHVPNHKSGIHKVSRLLQKKKHLVVQ